jgi:translation initiation factor 2 beta subunit (eIF-2beta)/eIF-5
VINLRKYLEKVIKTNSKAENVETAQETLERVFVRFIEPFFLKITKNPKKKHDVDSHIVVPLQKYLTETGDLDKQTALFLKFFLSSDEFRKRVIDYVELATKFAAKFG